MMVAETTESCSRDVGSCELSRRSTQSVKKLSKRGIQGGKWQESCGSKLGLMSGSAQMYMKILVSSAQCIHELVQLY